MDFTFLEQLSAHLSNLLKAANDLPGTVAFAAGAFSWFMVEQIIRRLASIIRGVLIFGLIAAAGVSGVALLNFFINRDTSGLQDQTQTSTL